MIGAGRYPAPYPFYTYGAYDPYYYSYYYSPFAYPYYWGTGRSCYRFADIKIPRTGIGAQERRYERVASI